MQQAALADQRLPLIIRPSAFKQARKIPKFSLCSAVVPASYSIHLVHHDWTGRLPWLMGEHRSVAIQNEKLDKRTKKKGIRLEERLRLNRPVNREERQKKGRQMEGRWRAQIEAKASLHWAKRGRIHDVAIPSDLSRDTSWESHDWLEKVVSICV